MTHEEVVSARKLNVEQASELFVLELPKGHSIPHIKHRLSYQGQDFLVVGLLDYGDGKGPVALALIDTEDAEEALS